MSASVILPPARWITSTNFRPQSPSYIYHRSAKAHIRTPGMDDFAQGRGHRGIGGAATFLQHGQPRLQRLAAGGGCNQTIRALRVGWQGRSFFRFFLILLPPADGVIHAAVAIPMENPSPRAAFDEEPGFRFRK